MTKLISFLTTIPWGRIAKLKPVKEILAKYPWLAYLSALALAALGVLSWDKVLVWLQ